MNDQILIIEVTENGLPFCGFIALSVVGKIIRSDFAIDLGCIITCHHAEHCLIIYNTDAKRDFFVQKNQKCTFFQ